MELELKSAKLSGHEDAMGLPSPKCSHFSVLYFVLGSMSPPCLEQPLLMRGQAQEGRLETIGWGVGVRIEE